MDAIAFFETIVPTKSLTKIISKKANSVQDILEQRKFVVPEFFAQIGSGVFWL